MLVHEIYHSRHNVLDHTCYIHIGAIGLLRPGGAGRVGWVRTRPISPPTSIFRKCDFILFQASLNRDVNLEMYSTMIRIAVFGCFPSTSQICEYL